VAIVYIIAAAIKGPLNPKILATIPEISWGTAYAIPEILELIPCILP
jgi:hypothetical protein